MERFARTAQAIAATPGKLEKIALLAEYLRALPDDDLAAAAIFFSGEVFPARERRRLTLGGSAIVKAAKRVWHVEDAALSSAYRRHGDLGAALAELVREPADLGLFRRALTPASLRAALNEIAAAGGSAAQRRRITLLADLLGSAPTPLVVKYVVKICTGDLRIGLREGLILDAIAAAFSVEPEAVRRANAAAGDLGAVALAARTGRLEELEVAYFLPIGFMLASPIVYGSAYEALSGGEWLIEQKFDGVRAQVHKRSGEVRIFSRRMNDVSEAFPEIVSAMAHLDGDAVLDGEIVAERDGRVQPFRHLQTRLQRKSVDPALVAAIPTTFVAFDLLVRNERILLQEPLAQRRQLLESILPSGGALRLSAAQTLGTPIVESLHERFEAARAQGNEGLMLKRVDSVYAPGKRGRQWFKLKRELSTLDCVVVAVEYGHGKRAGVLSDYTFAVRGRDGELVTIGKAYSGLTDAEIAELTAWFLAHRLDGGVSSAYRFPVEPSIVLEVAFDVIQRSDRHTSGFALRFPRIVRLRPDKAPSDTSTLEDVEALYAAMLAREGVAY